MLCRPRICSVNYGCDRSASGASLLFLRQMSDASIKKGCFWIGFATLAGFVKPSYGYDASFSQSTISIQGANRCFEAKGQGRELDD